ncbi:MAG TPA: M48 family metallopeptidase [Actinomycetota bacterium]|nr:M48 family metallopeptidase [Actinomycetota bacterium]
MSVARAILVVALVSIAAAVLLAVVSRTPEAIRLAKPPPDATDPSLGARFTDAEIARNGAYRGPAYLSYLLVLVVETVALVAAARAFVPRLVAATESWRGGWPTQGIVVALTLSVLLTLVVLPLGYVRFSIDHAWRLANQSTGAWLLDQVRGLGVGLVMSAIAAIAFLAVVRGFPRAWWAIGWVVFTLLTVVLTFLAPIVIAPLFNRFTPLPDGPLKERVVALAHDAGVDLDDVLVADASKRSTAENAYVTGIGASKRMVLYDTLIDAGDDRETAYVAAHELGHEVHDHIWKGIAVAALGLLVGFVALRWLATRPGLWAWGGAAGIHDVRALPLVALLVGAAGLLSLPLQNSVSRAFERQADTTAITLTHDPDTAVRVFRRLAFANYADLRPPRVAVWALFSHPPIPERIENALASDRTTTTP